MKRRKIEARLDELEEPVDDLKVVAEETRKAYDRAWFWAADPVGKPKNDLGGLAEFISTNVTEDDRRCFVRLEVLEPNAGGATRYAVRVPVELGVLALRDAVEEAALSLLGMVAKDLTADEGPLLRG